MRINLPLLPRSWNKLGAQCWWECIYFVSHFFIPQFSLMNANEINEIFGYWKMRVWLCVIYLCSTCKHPSRAFFSIFSRQQNFEFHQIIIDLEGLTYWKTTTHVFASRWLSIWWQQNIVVKDSLLRQNQKETGGKRRTNFHARTHK